MQLVSYSKRHSFITYGNWNILKTQMGIQLKWQSACLACTRHRDRYPGSPFFSRTILSALKFFLPQLLILALMILVFRCPLLAFAFYAYAFMDVVCCEDYFADSTSMIPFQVCHIQNSTRSSPLPGSRFKDYHLRTIPIGYVQTKLIMRNRFLGVLFRFC